MKNTIEKTLGKDEKEEFAKYGAIPKPVKQEFDQITGLRINKEIEEKAYSQRLLESKIEYWFNVIIGM